MTFRDTSIKLINPYSENSKFINFPTLDKDLKNHFDYIYHSYFPYTVSPRFFYQSGHKFTLRDMYWYIDRLYDCAPSSIVDVGCGECEWKRWFPNIFGVDYNNNPWSMVDLVREVNDKFFEEYEGRFDAGMNLNGILGITTSWNGLSDHIEKFMSLVKKRCLFTVVLNSISNVPPHLLLADNYNLFVREFVDILESLSYNLVLLDIPSHREGAKWEINYNTVVFSRPPHNNIRFILEHQ